MLRNTAGKHERYAPAQNVSTRQKVSRSRRDAENLWTETETRLKRDVSMSRDTRSLETARSRPDHILASKAKVNK